MKEQNAAGKNKSAVIGGNEGNAAECKNAAIDSNGSNAAEDENVVISSLVVETQAEKTQEVAAALAKIKGVEVHEIQDTKIVVTIEAPTVDTSADIAKSFIDIDGFIGMNIAYLNFEDDQSLYPEGL